MPDTEDSHRIRVLLVDDHPLYIETLALALGLDDRIEIVGQAGDGAQAIELALQLRPHVVLMDVYMPRLDGVEATSRLREDLPDVRVMMLSSSDSLEDIERARAAGATAYLTKDGSASSITEDVVRVSAGQPALTAREAA